MTLKFKYAFLFCTLLHCALLGQVEICDNGKDDDNDNKIDLNDEDCFCDVAASVSLIPNPSFEDFNCCPSEKSQLWCATDWIQASAPTTDYIHVCDFAGVDGYPPPQPFPDGEGILGFRDGRNSSTDTLDAYWKEYAGACLLNTMLADSIYRFQFYIGFVDPQKSPPLNVSFFGTPSCDFLPFGGGSATFGCPSNSPDWEKLGEVFVDGGSGDKWVRAYIDVVPDKDIKAIALGPDCAPVTSFEGIYYFFDELILIDLESFDLLIKEVEHPCNSNFTLSVPDNSDYEYQWYLDGVAISGEVFAELQQNYGNGSYQVRIVAGSACRISAPYDYIIPVFYNADTVSICQGIRYDFGALELISTGIYEQTFKTEDNCDSIVELSLEVIGETFDTIEVTVAPGEIYTIGDNSFDEEGTYNFSIMSSLGCDSLLFLKLNHYNVYIPNIFSPNSDGVNDVFKPFYSDEDVLSYEMKIYNRWGSLIYEGDAWDGRDLITDIYVYVIDVRFINTESNTFYGAVSLVR